MYTLSVSVCLAHAVRLFVYLCVSMAHAVSECVCVWPCTSYGSKCVFVCVSVCTLREDRQEQEEPGGSKYFANLE